MLEYDILLKLLDWARGEWESELSSDFRTLRSLPSSQALTFIAAYGLVPQEKRVAIPEALLSRTHAKALGVVGAVEQSERNQVLRHFDTVRASVGSAIRAKMLGGKEPPKVRSLRRITCERATPILGASESSLFQRDEWEHVLKVPQMVITTHIDIGASKRQLLYDHRVVLSEGNKEIDGRKSYLTLLGIGPTFLDLLKPNEAEMAAEIVSDLGGRFLSAISQPSREKGSLH